MLYVLLIQIYIYKSSYKSSYKYIYILINGLNNLILMNVHVILMKQIFYS